MVFLFILLVDEFTVKGLLVSDVSTLLCSVIRRLLHSFLTYQETCGCILVVSSSLLSVHLIVDIVMRSTVFIVGMNFSIFGKVNVLLRIGIP